MTNFHRTKKQLTLIILTAAIGLILAGVVLFKHFNRVFHPSCPECNLVLICIDTLRADHLSLYGYPRKTSPYLDRFAKQAIVYTNFYATIPETLPSIATMFTSKPPYVHKLQSNNQKLGADEITLAEILKGESYFTSGITSAAHVNDKTGLEQGFNTFISPSSGDRTAGATTNLALDWLTHHKDKKFFLFIHYFDPHWPYTPVKKYDIFTQPVFSKQQKKIAKYDGEIYKVDAHLKKIFDYLTDQNLLKKTLVIITSDHGEGLGEIDNYFDHGDLLYEYQINIPLIIYSNGRAFTSAQLAQNTQLFPTILQILGIKNHYTTIPSLLAPNKSKVFFYESDRCVRPKINRCFPHQSNEGKLIAARLNAFKYVYTPMRDGCKQELYDLSRDPQERQNIINDSSLGDISIRLKDKVFSIRNSVYSTSGLRQDDRQTLDALRSLGYIQ